MPVKTRKLPKRKLASFTGDFMIDDDQVSISLDKGGLMVHTQSAGKFHAFPVNESALILQDAWYVLQFEQGADGKFARNIRFFRNPLAMPD